jgi:cathepsin D
VTVQLGSEGEEFSLRLDSGSAEMWVVSSSCETPGCDTRPGLGPENSNTLNVTNTKFLHRYGPSDIVSGKIAKDDVTLAGMTFPMPFGLATQVSPTMTQNVYIVLSAV